MWMCVPFPGCWHCSILCSIWSLTVINSAVLNSSLYLGVFLRLAVTWWLAKLKGMSDQILCYCKTQYTLVINLTQCIRILRRFRFLWLHREQIVKRERKPTRCNNQMFYYQHCLNMFWASLCPSSGEQRPCVTACGVLHWFCWMLLVAVVGRCVVGCEHCEGYCLTVLRCGVRALWRLLFDHHSTRTLQCSAPQPLPTTSSRTIAAHPMQ